MAVAVLVLLLARPGLPQVVPTPEDKGPAVDREGEALPEAKRPSPAELGEAEAAVRVFKNCSRLPAVADAFQALQDQLRRTINGLSAEEMQAANMANVSATEALQRLPNSRWCQEARRMLDRFLNTYAPRER